MSDPIKSHAFCFNRADNGGEALTFHTAFFANGDPGGVLAHQAMTLHSYSDSATIDLGGAILTPELLRQLAQELEAAKKEAESLCSEQSQPVVSK